MIKLTRWVTQHRLGVILSLSGFLFMATFLNAQSSGIQLKDGLGGYQGNEDFYTYRMEGGVFNSKTDLDDQTLRVAPRESDAKIVMRFADIPISSSPRRVSRLAVVLTFKQPGSPDTLTVHNLDPSNVWDEFNASYNSINGAAPWSGIDGKLVDAWSNTDATAIITGSEKEGSQLVIEFHPNDPSARQAVLQSWLDGRNQGFAICGINSTNEFYSSDAYNMANRPELIIEF